MYELGKDVTVNVAADLSQEEPVAQTKLSAALRHLAVLRERQELSADKVLPQLTRAILLDI